MKVELTNLADNDFNFIDDLVVIGWLEYFNLRQYVALDILVKYFWRFVDSNFDDKVSSIVLGLPIKILINPEPL